MHNVVLQGNENNMINHCLSILDKNSIDKLPIIKIGENEVIFEGKDTKITLYHEKAGYKFVLKQSFGECNLTSSSSYFDIQLKKKV